MENIKEIFEHIQADRNGIVKSEEFPNLKRTYSRLYDKETHFIYELLQNAEDAKASSVTFIVNDNCLIFKHNGEKQFDELDIKAITGLGNPHKLEQEGMAGKFGIGFKSVFAYTETPQIFTDDFAFEITNMIVPSLILNKPEYSRNKGETLFVFPFNAPRKPSEIAIKEIEEGLLSIKHETLLFLENINEICYQLSNNKEGYILSKTNHVCDGMSEKHLYSIFNDTNEDYSLDYLVFTDNAVIKVQNDDGNLDYKNCRINIAYFLEDKSDKLTVKDIDGQVSIFFIANYAKSNLKFHVNAPFACPPTRDVINEDSQENKDMVMALASLAYKSLDLMVEHGYFSASSFSVFPLFADNVSNFFDPIKESMLKAAKNSALYPTKEGFKKINEVISSNDNFKEQFSIDDMRLLFNNQNLHFLLNPAARGFNFIKEIGVNIVDFTKLLRYFIVVSKQTIENLFSNKSNDWYLRTFECFGDGYRELFAIAKKSRGWISDGYFDYDPNHFSYLYDESKLSFESVVSYSVFDTLYRVAEKLYKCNIVRTTSNAMVSPSKARFVDTIALDKNVFEVNKNIYRNDSSKWFLERIGVKVYTKEEKEEHKQTLDKNKIIHLLKIANKENCFEIIRNVLDFVSTGIEYDIDFNDYSFILSSNDKLVSPASVYIDTPFSKTGFSKAKDILCQDGLNKKYKNKLDDNQLSSLMDFLDTNGGTVKLKLEYVNKINDNPNYYYLERMGLCQRRTKYECGDWTIKHLHKLNELKNVDIALQIWNIISNETTNDITYEDTNKLKAFNYIQNGYSNTAESTIVAVLKADKWIPTKDGKFKAPCDVSYDELLDEFVINKKSIFYDAICLFKKYNDSIKEKDLEYQRQKDAADSFGVDLDDIYLLKQMGEEGFDYKEAFENYRQSQISSHSNISNNPEGRAARVEDETEEAGVKEYTVVNRQVRSSSIPDSEIRTNLINLYTNSDGKMMCQICGNELPFKKKNREYYFEKKELDVKKGVVRYFKETKYHYIACCPNCAAMFDEYITKSKNEEEMVNLIHKILTKDTKVDENTKNESVSVVMDGKVRFITFVNKHILDIRASKKDD